ncbi:MAG TPA: hypothetical protein VFK56_10840 [Mycobacterium sp.]|nr:hypothetical protein [Mycobacterium sp.]
MTVFHRDSAGFAEILKSAGAQRAVTDLAEQVAKSVENQGIQVGAMSGGGQVEIPVETSTIITDRAHASVTLAHPAGLAVEAKYGALTKAAADAGLEVKERD